MNAIDAAVKEIREKKAFLVDAVAGGAAKDFADYKGLCGEIRGLTAVENYLIDLAKNLEYSDD